MKLVVALALAAILAVVGVFAGSGLMRAAASSKAGSASCPKSVLWEESATAPAEEVVHAARRLIPRAIRDPHYSSFIVQSAFSLEPVVPGLRDPARFRAIARERCGRSVALTSWVVAVQFPGAPNATAGLDVAFLSKTRAGWQLWYLLDPLGKWTKAQ